MENSSLKLAHVLINTDIERLHHGYFFRYVCKWNPSMLVFHSLHLRIPLDFIIWRRK